MAEIKTERIEHKDDLREIETHVLKLFDEYIECRVREVKNDPNSIKRLDNAAHLLRTVAGLIDPQTKSEYYGTETKSHTSSGYYGDDYVVSSTKYGMAYFVNVLSYDEHQFHPVPEGISLTCYSLSEDLPDIDLDEYMSNSKKSSFVENRVRLLKIVLAELNHINIELDDGIGKKFPDCMKVLEEAVKIVSEIDLSGVENRLRSECQARLDSVESVFKNIKKELDSFDYKTYSMDDSVFNTSFRRDALEEVLTKLVDDMRMYIFQDESVDTLSDQDLRKLLEVGETLKKVSDVEYNSEKIVFGNPVFDDFGLVDVRIVSNDGDKLVVEYTAKADHLVIKKEKGQIAPHAEIVKVDEPTVRRLEVEIEQLHKQGSPLRVPDEEDIALRASYKAEIREDKDGKQVLFIMTDKYIDRLNVELDMRKNESSELAEKFGWALPIKEMNTRCQGKLLDDNIKNLSREYMAVACDMNGDLCAEDDPDLDHFQIYKRVPLHKYRPGETIWIHDSSVSNSGRYKSTEGCAGAVIFGYGRSANWINWNEYLST